MHIMHIELLIIIRVDFISNAFSFTVQNGILNERIILSLILHEISAEEKIDIDIE